MYIRHSCSIMSASAPYIQTSQKARHGKVPLLYGMELGVFSDRQINTWQAQINTALKGLFRCSRHCSNMLFACVGIAKLDEYLDFKRSILENLISSNPYTQSILFSRMKNNMNIVCTADISAMLGSPRKM